MDELVKSLRIGVVNIVGVTVPGFIFVVVFVYSLVLPAAVVWDTQFPLNKSPDWNDYRTEYAIVCLVLSYIVGHLIRVIPMDYVEARGGWLPRWSRRPKEGGAIGPEDEGLTNRYPYSGLTKLLKKQGLIGLTPYVIWDGHDPERHHINAIKMAVIQQDERLGGVLGSVEAHVRLLYGLAVVGGFSFFSCLAGGAVCCFSGEEGMWAPRFVAAVLSLVICLVARGFIHRTRVSEVVRVLIAAYLCFEGDKEARRKILGLGKKQPSPTQGPVSGTS